MALPLELSGPALDPSSLRNDGFFAADDAEDEILRLLEQTIASADGSEVQKQRKKRNRTTTVSLACVTCRSGHRKCDGNQPICSLCHKKGIECIWDTKRAKRGPQKGTPRDPSKKRIRKDVVSMVPANITPGSDASMLIVNVSPFERTLNDDVLVDSYLRIYSEHITPLFFNAPAIDARSPWMPRSQQLYVTALLVQGAQAMEHSYYEKRFLESARLQLVAMAGAVDPFVAAAYGLLSSYYNSTGQLDTAFEMNTTACTMADELSKKHYRQMAELPFHLWTQFYEGVDLLELHVGVLEERAQYLDEQSVQINNAKMKSVIAAAAPYAEPEMIRLLSSCTNSLLASKYLLQRAQNPSAAKSAIAATQVINSIVGDLRNLFPSKFWRSSVIRRIDLLASALSSAIWLICERNSEAAKVADSTIEMIRDLGTPYRDFTGIAAVYIVAQVYLTLGDVTKYQSCLQLLLAMSVTHGLSSLALRSLEKIRLEHDLMVSQPESHVLTRELRIMTLIDLQGNADFPLPALDCDVPLSLDDLFEPPPSLMSEDSPVDALEAFHGPLSLSEPPSLNQNLDYSDILSNSLSPLSGDSHSESADFGFISVDSAVPQLTEPLDSSLNQLWYLGDGI